MFYKRAILSISENSQENLNDSPLDTGRRLNVHKTFGRRSERYVRSIYVMFPGGYSFLVKL